jgi:hypothetical protein
MEASLTLNGIGLPSWYCRVVRLFEAHGWMEIDAARGCEDVRSAPFGCPCCGTGLDIPRHGVVSPVMARGVGNVAGSVVRWGDSPSKQKLANSVTLLEQSSWEGPSLDAWRRPTRHEAVRSYALKRCDLSSYTSPSEKEKVHVVAVLKGVVVLFYSGKCDVHGLRTDPRRAAVNRVRPGEIVWM